MDSMEQMPDARDAKCSIAQNTRTSFLKKWMVNCRLRTRHRARYLEDVDGRRGPSCRYMYIPYQDTSL